MIVTYIIILNLFFAAIGFLAGWKLGVDTAEAYEALYHEQVERTEEAWGYYDKAIEHAKSAQDMTEQAIAQINKNRPPEQRFEEQPWN